MNKYTICDSSGQHHQIDADYTATLEET